MDRGAASLSGRPHGRRLSPLIVSDITLWEIAMLIKNGRLQADVSYGHYMNLTLSSFDLSVKPITTEIAEIAVNFDDSGNYDPADRLIAATAILEKAPLVTKDENLRKSKALSTIW